MSRIVLIRIILGKLAHHKQKVPAMMPLASHTRDLLNCRENFLLEVGILLSIHTASAIIQHRTLKLRQGKQRIVSMSI